MIDVLRKNVEKEIDILREMSIFSKRMELASPAEKDFLSDSLEALRNRMQETNAMILEILNKIQLSGTEETVQARPETDWAGRSKKESIEKPLPPFAGRERFLRELEITDKILKRIERKRVVEAVKEEGFKEASGYLKLANRFFLSRASSLTKKGYFSSLPSELKKSNLSILFETYVAAMLFTTLISFISAILLTVFLLFFEVNLGWPIVALYAGSFSARLLRVIWLPLIIPLAVFLIAYYYPSAEKNSISSRINEELPFAVIHMNSISGSGIEPTGIFRIIAKSGEYPFLRQEIRKVLNQTNVYGYDLVTALNNVSKSTSSLKLAELFAGLATTINSGGSLSGFFEKRAESLLLSYRLEKEKSIKVAETAMDIYISVVIAAPMILMLMLVMVSVSGIQIGFTPYELTFMTIGGVALINIVFLTYLQTRKNLY